MNQSKVQPGGMLQPSYHKNCSHENEYDGFELPPGCTFEADPVPRHAPVDGCALCKRERLTTWYYDIGDWWVASCVTCKDPIVVYIHHTMYVPMAHLDYIYKALRDGLFSAQPTMANYNFHRKSIPDHYYFHIRNM